MYYSAILEEPFTEEEEQEHKLYEETLDDVLEEVEEGNN